ncbi:HipA N-terminal domain-containing protein [Pedobacter metabolipauper]|uniref:Serine/threonine-protein kinase HipA n=1 Tax=Pedobacter metabolipauper TaxID=425513 RepID=A0A4R6SR71_9SPHI|nr:HipA N-terminal domain-containing protein [Pedobacter metabolipauper]TDQ07490.1 serine/threonine-protein kinase HipA [Pedobacter metabolipauper]
MTNKAKVLYSGKLAGYLEKNDSGYTYMYDTGYLKSDQPMPISQTLPLSEYPYNSHVLFSFFDGLIPEGWLLNIASSHWKINRSDRFKLLITLCRDTIGAVTVLPDELEEEAENG